MAFCRRAFYFSLAVIAAALGYAAHSLFEVPQVPKLDPFQWWGPGVPSDEIDHSVVSARVEFEPQMIVDLKKRLSSNDWFTEPLEGIGFEYGFNGNYLKEVAEFWKNKYDFKKREDYINKYPQFNTRIQGLNIHFVHIKHGPDEDKRIVPLLLLHGWPGSFLEFHKIIPLLTAPSDRDFVFDIVVPSLPGYGYSQAASKPGLGATQMAVIMRNLMKRLDYDSYVIQGGDWGAFITNAMSVLYPDEIYGYHTNMPVVQTGMGTLKVMLASLYPQMIVKKEHEDKLYPLTKIYQFLIQETGYLHIQATKPDTVGIGLMDSPIGLAAYILEKFSTWTDKAWMASPDGGLTKKYSMTELLDNIMVYWDSGCITTSMRLYAETMNYAHHSLGMDYLPVTVPTAVARFPNELTFTTESQMRGKYVNLVQVSDMEAGGHFAAFEEPALLADDIISAVAAFDRYHIKNRTQK